MSMWVDRARRPRKEMNDVAFAAAVIVAEGASIGLSAFALYFRLPVDRQSREEAPLSNGRPKGRLLFALYSE